MQFFTSPEDLRGWVKSQPNSDTAATKILKIYQEGPKPSESIIETCREIYKEDEDGNASKILFGVLAKQNITQVKGANRDNGIKGANNMNKAAQTAVQSRQRNNWVRGNRNKWNRVVDGFNEGTPWRIDRDKFYNFTHYYIDDLKFDEDPNHVYSGEAIWRMYIMDKFTGDYQDKNGRVVGGYINDRFYRFPTAGTPANPDVDRLQGNQMELALGERSRKPRPHQYSTERRLEEARGNKLEDLEAIIAKSKAVVKIASMNVTQDVKTDKIYSIFKDALEMREAGIEYPVMLEAISDHYNVGIMGVAQIDKAAQQLKKKHEGIFYISENLHNKIVFAEYKGPAFQVGNAIVTGTNENGQTITLPTGTVFSQVGPDLYQIEEDLTGSLQPLTKFTIQNMESFVANESIMPIDAAMEELSGETEELSGETIAAPIPAPASETVDTMQDFPVQEVATQNI